VAEHPTRTFKYVGKPFPVREDRRYVRGKGRYINDHSLPRQLYLAVAPASVAHAHLGPVDTSEALKVPGVVAVITGKDLAENIGPVPQNLVLPNVKWYPLAVDKIRYAGEGVAAVIATSRAIAEDAAELISFDYDELPPLVDPLDAMKPEAPLLHEDQGSNVVWQDQFTWGEVDEIFAAEPHVFEFSYRWNRNGGVPIETFGVVASYDRGRDELQVWASHQSPALHSEISRVLRMPENRVRLHSDIEVGGSYGAKRGRKQVFLTAYASKVCGRPVKYIEDRRENLMAGDSHGPDRYFDVRFAVSAEGKVRGLEVSIVDDVGAYVGRGPLQMAKPITGVVGAYTIEAVRYSGAAVVTNKTNQAPYRGFGMAPHNYIIDRSMDRIARALGIDRVEIRRRNLIPADAFPYRIPSGSTYDSGDFQAALDLALAMPGCPLIERPEAPPGKLIGVGIATCVEPSGGNQAIFSYLNPGAVHMTPETARVELARDGALIATIGFQSTGQSHESFVAQLLCEELGFTPDRVEVQRGDSRSGMFGSTPTGDRMTLMLGKAVLQAAGKLRDKMARIAAFNLEVSTEDLVYDDLAFSVKEDPGARMTVDEIVSIAYTRQTKLPEEEEPGLSVTATAKLPGGGLGLDEQKRLNQGFPSCGFSVHIPVVEIDEQTFQVRLRDYYVVHDCGTVINPLIVDGMVIGGIAQALGSVLLEQFAYSEDGQPLSTSFMDYLLPTAETMPRITMDHRITPAPVHPYGAKGSGEGGYLAGPAAIASAVDDALIQLGVEVNETPITPGRIFTAWSSRRTAGAPQQQEVTA
jgi:CO/xanthine dehydrogenase Mo-binding subunit